MHKVLIVLHLPKGVLSGGHVKSAFELANTITESGVETYIFTNINTPLLSILDSSVKIIEEKKSNKIKGYFTKYKVFKKLKETTGLDAVISFDKHSTYHASLACAALRLALIPIIPGGDPSLFKVAPLNLPKYIAFSQESIDALISRYKFQPDQFILNSARFHLPYYTTREQYKPDGNISIAYLTGLRLEKFNSFKYFIDQLSAVSLSIKVAIIGEGPDSEMFEQYGVQCSNIEFKGFHFVIPENMQSYDFVVTMGRGVIECLNMGLPTAVCGHNGYIGLVSEENFFQLLTTNFTGRNAIKYSTLEKDLERLLEGYSVNPNLVDTVRSTFSNEKLVHDIKTCHFENDLVPFNGNWLKAIISNLFAVIKSLQ